VDIVVAELNVSLSNIDLILVVQIITDLQLTGQVQAVQDDLTGAFSFDQGRMIGAAFDTEYGLAALELIFLTMPDAVCTFSAALPVSEPDIDLSGRDLDTFLYELSRRRWHLAAAVSSLAAVPQMIHPHEVSELGETVVLPPRALTTLQMIDGRRTVRAISQDLGLARTICDLAILVDRGLICVGSRSGDPSALPAQPPSPAQYGWQRASKPSSLRSDTGVLPVSSTEPPAKGLCGQVSVALPDRSHLIAERRPPRMAAVHNVQGGWAKTQRTRGSDQWWVAGEAGRRKLRPSVPGALLAVALFVCLTLLYSNGLSSKSERPESQRAHSATDTISLSKVDAPERILRTVLDERFASNVRNWRNNPDSTAWIADRTYQLFVRRPGQFIAIGAPLMDRFKDVVVTGRFRKTGGPAGGAYGLLVRDQGPGPRDGLNQTGTYYVLGVTDQGVAIRRRVGDHWVDVAPWTPSAAVSPNGGTIDLTALAMGQQLALMVNGTVVATATDNTASEGTVGIFTSGDLNEVGLEQFIVEVPTY
jgi:hypothetical protein